MQQTRPIKKKYINADNGDFTKLMNAIKTNDINKFKKLIKLGADINSLNKNQKTLISKILSPTMIKNKNNHDFFDILIKNNVSLKRIGNEQNLLSLAMRIHHIDPHYFHKLLKNNININDCGVYMERNKQIIFDPPIFEAIRRSNPYCINMLLLKEELDIEIENKHGEVLLNFLIKNYSINKNQENLPVIFKKLINDGYDPNARGHLGEQTLHCLAEYYFQTDLFEFLFNSNNYIDINSKTMFGDTALKIAAKHGNINAVKFLIEKKADLNIPSLSGKTAILEAATGRNNLNIFKILLKNNADLKITDNNQNNILHYITKHKKCINKIPYNYYINKISNLHPEFLYMKNKYNDTPLQIMKRKENTII